MARGYLNNLSSDDYSELTNKLLSIQNGKCFICQKEIDLEINETNIDHIIPRNKKGKDNEENFAVTHESCNKSKQDSDLNIARVLHKLTDIQRGVQTQTGKSASLKDVLKEFGGSKHEFKFKIEGDKIKYSFDKMGSVEIKESDLHTDKLSDEKSAFIEVPIEYLYHDGLINPRGINNSISKLIKEFDTGNPQLHLSLGRLEDGKIKIFDGQHKAVAQLMLGVDKLMIRVFVDPNIDRLIETNTKAGSTLRQIAFDKAIMRQLNNVLYAERIKKYQEDHNLSEDDLTFSEQQLVDYFKGDNVNVKKYIVDSIRHSITHHKNNKLKDYIDFDGKAKDLPISYSAFDKTFLSNLVNYRVILNTPINYKSDEGMNPREIEINQLVKLANIIAEEVYINKFDPEVGVYRIEQSILKKKDSKITDEHLIAYRISKEEVIKNWLNYLVLAINNYFSNTGLPVDGTKLFQHKFDEQLWINIRTFMHNLSNLPLWKDRLMADTIFAGKNSHDFWSEIFRTGQSPDGVQVLAKPLNFIDLIKPRK